MADTLRASERGLSIVDEARRQKRWTKTETVEWLTTSKVSKATLKRFWRRIFIDRGAFIAICSAVQVDWRQVCDLDIRQSHIENAQAKEGLDSTPQLGIAIPSQRCRTLWGRESDIKVISGVLQDSRELPITCLWGGPGYGKTELAAQVSRTLINTDEFANVLWVTARTNELVEEKIVSTRLENTGRSYTSKIFWGEIARQLECSLHDVRQQLRREKYLVVLDNAETSDLQEILAQLVEVLTPSRALITSRIKTRPQYVQVLEVKGLDRFSSFELLSNEAKVNNIDALTKATKEQLDQLYELSCGAPLALHFIVGRVFHDGVLEPVISELIEAGKRVEAFYKFCFETAWHRIEENSKNILRYAGHLANTGVLELDFQSNLNLSWTEFNEALAHLKQWCLVEEKLDVYGNRRIDLHPWVRSSVRGGLVESWQPSREYLQEVAKLKREQIRWMRPRGKNGL